MDLDQLHAQTQEFLPGGVQALLFLAHLSRRELGSTGNYFRGAMEQAHSYGDLGSPAKKKKKKIRKSLHFV